MPGLTWLHLSDWHQKDEDFNRTVVRDALVRDIRDREAQISPDLGHIDFIVFSGDAAHYGKEKEYKTAVKHLFDPVLDAAGVGPERLFIVPGNHDLDRDVFELMPEALLKPFTTEEQIQEWLTNGKKRNRLLEPFEEYNKFLKPYANGKLSAYGSLCRFEADEKKIAMLCLNSSLMCSRNKNDKGETDDYGKLVLGEPQIYEALGKVSDADICFAVMHHPFDFLIEPDRNRVKDRLGKACHFILCGHQHVSHVRIEQGTSGDCVIIPAGASYNRRVSEDPRYINAYNYVHLDIENRHGVVYLRSWSDRKDEWREDVDAHEHGKMEFKLPKELGSTPGPSEISTRVPAAHTFKPSVNQREKEILEGYLRAMIRDHKDLDPRGIKQTKVQLVLPLEEIYVSLQADRDRPDVDRRVMQDEIEEIRHRLEQFEDPGEREKQYNIWATQARVIQSALEVAGQHEELHDIIRRHRQLVVLGDPGSGKTTLLRYLTFKFAQEILKNIDRLFAPQDFWNYKDVWRLDKLGPVRLPVLLRISKYADARNPNLQGNPNLAMYDFLPIYFAGLNVPDARELKPIFRKFLEAGRCLVLFDGLDEIVNPSERSNIASAINQFVGVYRETGLPDWLARSISTGCVLDYRDEPGAFEDKELDDFQISWDKQAPEDQRMIWLKNIRKMRGYQSRQGIRDTYKLLGEDRYAHAGNRFAVTSRIAGYHFAPLGGEFEHFTIRRMEIDDIKLFLEKWCPAVEKRMADDPDPEKVRESAQREVNGILESAREIPGVRRMAANPLLLRILAIIHRSEAHLPQRRVELYETAAMTLLRDWNLQKELKVAIDEKEALSLLGMVALWTHENRASGLITKGEVEEILGLILANRHGLIGQDEVDQRLNALGTGNRGSDNDMIPIEIEKAVEKFLVAVREHSGLYVERGEGLYGFMHLTFEEYFTARQLVSSSARAREEILKRLHQPRWHEPVLLAVGYLSNHFYGDTNMMLQAVVDHGKDDPYESVLHRNLLFATACVGDSINVFHSRRYDMARRLLSIYCDRKGAGRYKTLQNQIRSALQTLCNDQGDEAVEQALAEVLESFQNHVELECALEIVDLLKARTREVVNALEKCCQKHTFPGTYKALYEVKERMALSGDEKNLMAYNYKGWRDYLDSGLARFMGGLWYSFDHWKDFLRVSLGLSKKAVEQIETVFHYLTDADSLFHAFEKAGMIILKDASKTRSLATHFSDAAKKIITSDIHDERELLSSVLHVIRELRNNLHDQIKKPDDFQQYNEIALLFIVTSLDIAGERVKEKVSSVLLKNLENSDKKYFIWSLQVLTQPGFHQNMNLSPSQSNLLFELLDGPVDQALCALNLLPLTPDFLKWSWDTLRQPNHPIADNVREKLERITGIPGTSDLLDLLEQGMFEPELRPTALEMLRNVQWQGIESFAYALRWLTGEDNELRYSGAMMLAEQNDIFDEVYELLQGISHNRIQNLISLTQENKTKEKWTDLKNEPNAIRMLRGLWVNGWSNILTRLWVGKSSQEYIVKHHSHEYWQDSYEYPKSETVVQWLLEKAKYSQSLIPTIRQASEKLAELEKEEEEVDGPPDSDHIRDIIYDLTEQWSVSPDMAALLASDTLRQIMVFADDTHPLLIWLENQIALQGLCIQKLSIPEKLKALSDLLLSEDDNIRMVAAFSIFAVDLHTLIVQPLIEAALAQNDRDRNPSFTKLLEFCERLPSDGSSCATDELLKLRYRNKNKAKGYSELVYYNALRRVNHTNLHFIKSWIERLSKPDVDSELHRISELGLEEMGTLSEKSIRYLLEQGANTRLSQSVRKHILVAISENQRSPHKRYSAEWFTKALCQMLRTSETEFKQIIAGIMKWSEGEDTWKIVQVLLKIAEHENDRLVQQSLIISSGRVLRSAYHFCNTFISKDSLFQWLMAQVKRDECSNRKNYEIDESELKKVISFINIDKCSDAEMVMDALSQLEKQDIHFIHFDEYNKLLQAAKEEWHQRQQDRSERIYSYLKDFVSEIEKYLLSDDAEIQSAAACALACAFTYEEDRISRLAEKLDDTETIMWALIESASDYAGSWVENDYHEKTIKQVGAWLIDQPDYKRTPLIDSLLSYCKTFYKKAQDQDGEYTSSKSASKTLFGERSICFGILAELSEHFTDKEFTKNIPLDEIVDLFVLAACDPVSYITRGFAIHILGNLQQFTRNVAEVFFEACQDDPSVYKEAHGAVGKFKYFDKDSLAVLTKAIEHPSITVAHQAALLLGELGVSRTQELGAEGRRQVADELVRILNTPAAERIVYDFTENINGKRIGPLYDILYDVLIKVVAGPDALGITKK